MREDRSRVSFCLVSCADYLLAKRSFDESDKYPRKKPCGIWSLAQMAEKNDTNKCHLIVDQHSIEREEDDGDDEDEDEGEREGEDTRSCSISSSGCSSRQSREGLFY